MYSKCFRSSRVLISVTGAVAAGALIVGCQATTPEPEVADDVTPSKVTLIVHDSFVPEEDFEDAASAATGYAVDVITAGDGGELTNQLVLTKGAPLADAFFGVDHIFASRLIQHDVVEPYLSAELPARAADFAVDEVGSLTAIDLGATCINVDTPWFETEGVTVPETYEDLAKPEYENLTVLLDPTSSSTGASFLIGTIAHFGEDGYLDYWSSLIDNGARVEQSWNDAYYTHFTGGNSEGTYPIVVSYSSSPGYTITEDGTASTTAAPLATCSSQVEYAGVLAGAENPEGAQAVIDYMLSEDFQNSIADTMYVYPIDENASVPAEWAEFAPLPDSPNDLTAAEIGAGRDGWLKALSEVIGL